MAEAGPLVVLASASPRRLELLRRIGVEPVVRPAHVDESVLPGEDPVAYVRRLAETKARAVAGPGELVIGADTTVTLHGEVFGKPVDAADARRMLRALSGTTHHVHTAVFVVGPAGHGGGVSTADVTMRAIAEHEIDVYVASGEPADKAGAYAVQGAGGAFVEAVCGSDSGVIGLPLALVVDLARRAGADLFRP